MLTRNISLRRPPLGGEPRGSKTNTHEHAAEPLVAPLSGAQSPEPAMPPTFIKCMSEVQQTGEETPGGAPAASNAPALTRPPRRAWRLDLSALRLARLGTAARLGTLRKAHLVLVGVSKAAGRSAIALSLFDES